VTAQAARAAMTSTVCRAIAGIQADLRLIQAEAVLAECEIFFHRPPKPGGADQPGHADALAFGTKQ
jgi:hypothetical protein